MATAFDTPAVPFSGPFAELPTQLLEASTRALDATAELYTEVITSQAEATRAVLAAYTGLGTQAVQAGAETTEQARETAERAEQLAAGATRRTGTAAKAATRRTAGATRRAAGATRRAAPKPQPRQATGLEAPIAGYDELTPEELVTTLPEQPQTLLAQIAAYEQANEKRATVLQRVAVLSGPEPAPGYDEMTTEEATKLANDASPALAATVRDYERRHKGRASVIEAATRVAEGDAS